MTTQANENDRIALLQAGDDAEAGAGSGADIDLLQGGRGGGKGAAGTEQHESGGESGEQHGKTPAWRAGHGQLRGSAGPERGWRGRRPASSTIVTATRSAGP